MKVTKVTLALSAFISLLVFTQCEKEEAPTCEITNPVSAGQIQIGEQILISVDAEDSDGQITDVKFYIDGTGVGLATEFPYNYKWNTIGLSAGEYTIKAKATDNMGNTDEDELSIRLGLSGEFYDSRDNQKYKTVIIGTQVWMAENLAYLPAVNPPSEESYTERHYYVYGYEGTSISAAKSTYNYETHGVLYNWPAAMSACPGGWHLPTDAEWKQLEMYIGMSQSEADDGSAWRGINEGTKLKATNGWSNNGNGTDEFSFGALPGGFRYYLGFFNNNSIDCLWWSATESGSSHSYYRHLNSNKSGAYRHIYSHDNGLSVRCVKDSPIQ